jgi:hypothetical protein
MEVEEWFVPNAHVVARKTAVVNLIATVNRGTKLFCPTWSGRLDFFIPIKIRS